MADDFTSDISTANPQLRFLLDPILPTVSVSLLGGRSGSGKTTLLLQILEDWQASREVFGSASYPAPFCYVACAKPREAILQTASRISLDLPFPFPICSLANSRLHPDEQPSPEAALKLAREITPNLRLLILDGIGVLCSGRVTEYNVVATFMRRLTDIALREQITILGVGPMAKSGNETPRASRELFLGSVAWGEHADTMILIDKDDPSDPRSTARTVTILPTNAPTQVLNYDFDPTGRLILLTDNSIQEHMLDMKLAELKPGETFTAEAALLWAKEVGASRATVYRWIKKYVEDGRVDRVSRGIYVVRHRV